MNVKRVFASILAVCVMLALCACGSAEAPAAEATEAPVITPTEAPATEAPEEPAEPEGPVYSVKVEDESGNPMAGVMVQVCMEVCVPGMTGDDGIAVFAVEEADYKASVMVMPAGYGYATEQQEFYFDGGYEVTIVLKTVA